MNEKSCRRSYTPLAGGPTNHHFPYIIGFCPPIFFWRWPFLVFLALALHIFLVACPLLFYWRWPRPVRQISSVTHLYLWRWPRFLENSFSKIVSIYFLLSLAHPCIFGVCLVAFSYIIGFGPGRTAFYLVYSYYNICIFGRIF